MTVSCSTQISENWYQLFFLKDFYRSFFLLVVLHIHQYSCLLSYKSRDGFTRKNMQFTYSFYSISYESTYHIWSRCTKGHPPKGSGIATPVSNSVGCITLVSLYKIRFKGFISLVIFDQMRF